MSLPSKVNGAIRARLQFLGYTLEPTNAPRLALLVDPFLRMAGFRLKTYLPHPGFGFIDYQATAAAAKAAELSIPSYVAKLWGDEGLIEWIVDRIAEAVPLHACCKILEIGAGTGRTLELIHERAKPTTYEVYEPDKDWTAYLVERYGVIDRQADGVSLTPTPTESCDLVQAHGVFVYLPLGNAFRYFQEMIRVVRPGGWIVFDLFADDQVTLPVVQDWMRSGQDFHLLMPRKAVVDMFVEGGCSLIHQFDISSVHCQYLVFQKRTT